MKKIFNGIIFMMFVAIAVVPIVYALQLSTAKLSEAAICKSVDPQMKKPIGETGVFSPDTPEIFCSVKLSNAPETKVTAKWIYVRGEQKDLENYLIDEYSLNTDGTKYLSFSLTRPDKGFPRGEYVVKLFLDNEEKISVSFMVE